jgi:hypothetical protein
MFFFFVFFFIALSHFLLSLVLLGLAQQFVSSAGPPPLRGCRLILPPNCAQKAIGSLHEHEDSCQYFYRCNEAGVAIAYSCPEGQYFRGTKGDICVPAEQVTCERCPPRVQSTAGRHADECPAVCPATEQCTSVGQWLPYPPDCTQYIYCDSNLQPVLTPCYNGQQFDPDQCVCMDASMAECPYCVTGW